MPRQESAQRKEPAQQHTSRKYIKQTLLTAELDNVTAQGGSVYCSQSHTSLFITDEPQLLRGGNICGTSTLNDGLERFMRVVFIVVISVESGGIGTCIYTAISERNVHSWLWFSFNCYIFLHVLCMTLCTPFHPNYRDFLIDVLLSLLSEPVLLLWDEALFVCTFLYVCTVAGWSQFSMSSLLITRCTW